MRASFSLVAAVALAAAACSPLSEPASPTRSADDGALASRSDNVIGAVFIETNSASGNAVISFARAADGTLSAPHTYATGALGSGGTVDPLASQYAIVLSGDNQFLYAVNAGSNSITAFAVNKNDLTRLSTVAAGGTRPVSLAVFGNVLYSLNTGSNTLTGFVIGSDGALTRVPSWTRSLSAGATGAAAVRFNRDGNLLAVAERTSQTIDTYLVNDDGSLSAAISNHSSGAVPFGFDFTPQGTLIASEAGATAVSSYVADADGVLHVVTASASTRQAAPCWLIATVNGRFAYTANAGGNSISGFAVAPDGSISLVTPNGATGTMAAGSTPLDLDVSRDSRFLYVLKAGTGTVGAYAIAADGSLSALPDSPAVVAPRSGQMGLASF
jgi:6-phosphogluconolactonase (cycloisomerase 2 family)